MNVRWWAAKNLMSNWPYGNWRYTGTLDFVYEIKPLGQNGLTIVRQWSQDEAAANPKWDVGRPRNDDGEHLFLPDNGERRAARAVGEITLYEQMPEDPEWRSARAAGEMALLNYYGEDRAGGRGFRISRRYPAPPAQVPPRL